MQGQFNNGWKHINTVISETGNGNALFSGSKQALNLKLIFSDDVVLLKLSLVSNSSKYVQLMYEYEGDISGQVGLRVLSGDTKFDNFKVTYSEDVPLGAVAYDFEQYSQLPDFTLYQPAVYNGRMYSQNSTNQYYFWTAVLNQKFEDVKTVSVNMYSAGSTRFLAGYYVGTDSGALGIGVGSRRGNRARNEIVIHSGSDPMAKYTEVTRAENSTFFASPYNNAVNITMSFDADSITTTVTRLDDSTKTLTYDYAFDYTKFNGQLGFISDASNVYFEDLQITYGADDQVAAWNFDDVAQGKDFTYYTPNKSNTRISDGQLLTNNAGRENLGSKAVLNTEIENISTISVDINYSSTSRCFGGLLLGSTDNYLLFECGNRRGNRTRGEIVVKTVASYSELAKASKTAEYHQTGGSYGFYSDLLNQPVNLTLTIEADKIIATMTRLDDSSKTLTLEYPYDTSLLNGQVGIASDASALKFDNLVITTESDLGETAETETIYLNEGYNFLETNRWQWELTKQVNDTPYTMEAWVRVPKGIEDSKTGRIIGNAAVMPYVVMEMTTYGCPSFTWKQEGKDGSSFVMDVDIRTGKWTHIAYTYDVVADKVTGYINGEAVAVWDNAGLEAMVFNETIVPLNPFVIGGAKNIEKNNIARKFPGWIADVRLWNYALSAEELLNSMMTQYTTAKNGLLFNAPLNELVNDQFVDLSGNDIIVDDYKLKGNWIEDTSEPGAYSMIVIPDQQILTNYYPEKLNAIYQWIADNQKKENIQIIMNVGDIADHCGTENEWVKARAAYDILPDDLPFIAAPGNHDYDSNPNQGNREALTLMNQYFPLSEFEKYYTEFGAFSRDNGLEDNVANTWQAFEVNGNKYLIIALEYFPANDVLDWASGVVESHSDHQVIMITHHYLDNYANRGGTRTDNNMSSYKNTPIEMWDKFISQHENIIMTFNGHSWSEYIARRVDKGVNGNDVYQFLTDIQVPDAWYKGWGLIAILRFNEDGTQCDLSYYSPIKDMCLNEDSVFTIELPKQEKSDVAQGGEQTYTTVTEAIANGNMVKLLASTDEAITISTDVTIDLAGYNLSNVTVAEGGKLNLIDTRSGGTAAVTGNVETFTEANGITYLVVGQDNIYSAHSYDVSITHITLDPKNDALGYKAALVGDETVQAYATELGFNLWVSEDQVITRGKAASAVTLRLKNILANNGGEMDIHATAFVTLNVNGETYTKTCARQTTSMKQTLQFVDAAWSGYTEAQQTAVKDLCSKFYDVVSLWDLKNIFSIIEIPLN